MGTEPTKVEEMRRSLGDYLVPAEEGLKKALWKDEDKRLQGRRGWRGSALDMPDA